MVVLVLGTMNYSLLYLAHLYHTSLFFTRQNMQYSTKPEKFGQFPFFAIVQRKKIWLWHADVLYGIFWSVNVLFWKAVCPGYLVETSCKVVNANKLCKNFDWSRLMWWWNMCIIYDKMNISYLKWNIMKFEASGWCIHNGGVDRGKKVARLPQLPGWEGSEQDGCARIYSPLSWHFEYLSIVLYYIIYQLY